MISLWQFGLTLNFLSSLLHHPALTNPLYYFKAKIGSGRCGLQYGCVTCPRCWWWTCAGELSLVTPPLSSASLTEAEKKTWLRFRPCEMHKLCLKIISVGWDPCLTTYSGLSLSFHLFIFFTYLFSQCFLYVLTFSLSVCPTCLFTWECFHTKTH